MKNVIQGTRTTLQQFAGKAALASAALVGTTATAMASESGTSAAVAAMESMGSQGSEMIGAAWPIATTIVGGLIGIKLFKKFANRAS
ncbi:major coat protein [Salinicola avicenniae]|uniref:major coat protein n=1 Tax=Salinicola avicenniae TaxID=2916836 RepID=UPI002073DF93|nr:MULTISPECIES: major coat protein [unclassified Salinicola]